MLKAGTPRRPSLTCVAVGQEEHGGEGVLDVAGAAKGGVHHAHVVQGALCEALEVDAHALADALDGLLQCVLAGGHVGKQLGVNL